MVCFKSSSIKRNGITMKFGLGGTRNGTLKHHYICSVKILFLFKIIFCLGVKEVVRTVEYGTILRRVHVSVKNNRNSVHSLL
jgi:hypothetical protein